MSVQAVTVRLQRLSQLRALCLSLAAAGRRAGLAPHSAGQQVAECARSGPADSQTCTDDKGEGSSERADERWAKVEAELAESEPEFFDWSQATTWIRDRTSSTPSTWHS